MAIIQESNAVFYHPLDSATESLQAAAWAGPAGFSPGTVADAMVETGDWSVGALGIEADFFVPGDSGDFVRFITVAWLDTGRFVVAWAKVDGIAADAAGGARVGSVSGTDVTWGTAVGISTAGNAPTDIHLAALDATKFAIAYRNSAASVVRVGSVSGTAITLGAETVLNATAIGSPGHFVAGVSATKFIVAYRDGGDSDHGTAKVGTVSGTDVTFGAEAEYRSTGGAQSASIAVLSATKIVVGYTADGPGGFIAAKVGAVSGTAITFGTEAKFQPVSGGGNSSVVALSETKVVAAYSDGSDSDLGKAKVGTVGISTIAFGAEVGFVPTPVLVNSAAAIGPDAFVVVYRDDANGWRTRAVAGTVSGTGITFSAEATVQGDSAAAGSWQGQVATIPGVARFVVAYSSPESNWFNGTAKISSLSLSPAALANSPDPGTFGAESEFRVGSALEISAAALSATKFVVAYRDAADAGHGTAKVGTVSGTDITFGAEVEFLGAGAASDISAAALTPTTFVVAYADASDLNHGTARVGTVSGTAITFGAEAEFLGAGTASDISVSALSATGFVVAYADGADSSHGTAKAGTVSGTAITFGAEAEFLSAGAATDISIAALDASKFVVAYNDGADSGHGTAKAGTVSGTAIAFGAEAEFRGDQTSPISVATLSPTRFVVAYQGAGVGSRGTVSVGTVFGTSIVFGAPSEFVTNIGGISSSAPVRMDAGKVVVAYGDVGDSNNGTTRAVSIPDPYSTVVSASRLAFASWSRSPD